MGCSSAYFLASSGRLPPSAICVVERDTKVINTKFTKYNFAC